MAETVVVLGAGATKSCGGPLTNEILHDMLKDKSAPDTTEKLNKLEGFLTQVFRLPTDANNQDFPGLPLFMSLLDTALERRQSFHKGWDVAQISEIRQAMELGIFELLERKLNQAQTTNHHSLLSRLYPPPVEPHVISLNYDLLIDTAMMFYSEQYDNHDGRLPNYCCDIQTEFYKSEPRRFGTLLKLHGSLNWLHCKTCHRLEIGASESKRFLKVLNRLLGSGAQATLDTVYLSKGSPCQICSSEMRPLLVAPSHLKDYRNPHLMQIWYEAERILRQSKRVIFIGYSLPDDDLEVVYLFKRALAHLEPAQITVVEYALTNPPLNGHEVGRRYRALFGDVSWHPEGIDNWLLKEPQAVQAQG